MTRNMSKSVVLRFIELFAVLCWYLIVIRSSISGWSTDENSNLMSTRVRIIATRTTDRVQYHGLKGFWDGQRGHYPDFPHHFITSSFPVPYFSVLTPCSSYHLFRPAGGTLKPRPKQNTDRHFKRKKIRMFLHMFIFSPTSNVRDFTLDLSAIYSCSL
jgi:hypothetical protein